MVLKNPFLVLGRGASAALRAFDCVDSVLCVDEAFVVRVFVRDASTAFRAVVEVVVVGVDGSRPFSESFQGVWSPFSSVSK